ncbi:hypothetical protein HK102_008468, partial [Quaeritorhiza haematococci]
MPSMFSLSRLKGCLGGGGNKSSTPSSTMTSTGPGTSVCASTPGAGPSVSVPVPTSEPRQESTDMDVDTDVTCTTTATTNADGGSPRGGRRGQAYDDACASMRAGAAAGVEDVNREKEVAMEQFNDLKSSRGLSTARRVLLSPPPAPEPPSEYDRGDGMQDVKRASEIDGTERERERERGKGKEKEKGKGKGKAEELLERVQRELEGTKRSEALDKLFLGRYRISDVLGEGAFSTVYKAVDTTSDETVALKVIPKERLTRQQIFNTMKEIRVHSPLTHPNIVRLHNWHESRTAFVLVLEYMPGGELFHKLVERTAFSERVAREVMKQVGKAVEYLHLEKGVVHRDLKLENLLLKPNNQKSTPTTTPNNDEEADAYLLSELGTVKVCDFGLCKVIDDSASQQVMTPCGT